MAHDANAMAEDYVQLWDVSGAKDLADRLFAPDFIDHNLQPGQGPGVQGVKDIVAVYHSVFPDLRVSNDDVVASGDRVTVRWSATGTHDGDQLGVPATHRRVRLTGIDILRIHEGRIAERWGETNGLEMMQQVSPS